MNAKNALIFSAGAIVGSIVTFYYTKKVITEIAEEEIKSVREAFRKSNTDSDSEPDAMETSTIDNYAEFVKGLDYTSYGHEPAPGSEEEIKIEEPQAEEIKPSKDGPRVILPEDFAENPDLGVYTLTYYADGVLTDDQDNVINPNDYDSLVGSKFFNHFGENVEDPDTVYIINPHAGNYYEIQFNYDRYEDLMKSRPYDVG